MGEIAEATINGDFDFYTGEYLGRGYGIPRTNNKSLEWERRNKPTAPKDYLSSKEAALIGVKNYIKKRWRGSAGTPSIRSIVCEYLGESSIDLKQKCLDIQKDFGLFIKFINQKLTTK